jgi:NAD(P)-dependent dehydrogenase (short-subunit alcohol dehydrogenase family)
MLLEGHRAVVTGGARGIGLATATRMAAEGASVAIVDIDLDDDAAAATGLPAFVADVADADALEAALGAAADALGGLTLLFNNAGFGAAKPLHRYTSAEWSRVVEVNLTGTFNGIRAAVPLLRASGGGAIVNMAGTTGVRPARGEAPYAAAKAGVIALTRSAALEYAPTIRVNCVSPGYIHTRLTQRVVDDPVLRERIESRIPMGRIGTADEVASVVVLLCSDFAAYVTGQNLHVDGGSWLPSHQSDDLLKEILSRFDD